MGWIETKQNKKSKPKKQQKKKQKNESQIEGKKNIFEGKNWKLFKTL